MIGKDTFTLRTADPQASLTQEKRVVFLSRAGKHLATENVSLKRRIPVSLHLLRKVTYTACRTRCRNNGNLALPYIIREIAFQFVDVSFDHSSVLRKCQSRYHCSFVSLNPCDKTLEFANLARSDFFEPVVKLFSCPCAQHLGKLLNEVVS